MVEVYDVLAKEERDIYEDMFVFSERHDLRYVLSVPHSGKFIPLSIVNQFHVGRDILIGSDLHTEYLYDLKCGIRVVCRLNNYAVNMNRAIAGNNNGYAKHMKDDPLHGSLLTGQPARRKEATQDEKQYLLSFYHQYHSLLLGSLDLVRDVHGFALLFDCHSLNSVGLKGVPDEGKERPDFCLGTLDDTSADPRIIDACYHALQKEATVYGYTVAKNAPYKGGFITQHYGSPKEGVHAIQLEVKKSLYMHEGLGAQLLSDFTIREGELMIVSSIIRKAFDAAFDEAKRVCAKK